MAHRLLDDQLGDLNPACKVGLYLGASMSRSLLAFANSPIAYPTSSVWRAAVNYTTDGATLWVERDTGCRESQLIELRVTGYQWKGFNAAERFTDDGKLAT